MRVAAALALVAAFAVAAVSVWAADPDQALAAGPVLLLAVAIALSIAGAAAWRRAPRSPTGPLLLAAAGAWCAQQLASPAAPSAVLFTLGLALGAAAPAAIALALLPDRRAGAALAVASLGLLGVAPALVFDPAAAGCAECPANLLLVHGDADLYATLQRAGLWLGLAAIAWLLVATAQWLRRASATARERGAPARVAAAAYLIAVGAQYVHGLPRGYLSSDATDRTLWTLQALALLAVATAQAWEPVRERRARARLARLVVALEARAEPAGVRDVLAGVLGDPDLRLGYRLADGRVVGASGRPFAAARGQVISPLRDGGVVLAHAPGLLDDPALAPAIASAARLPLRNERLHAELRARLEDLRAMRSRIVTAADAERRRLERDLHDGAQQGLASLAVSVEAARRRCADPVRAAVLGHAHGEIRAALGALREVAHGLVPAVLADEGLAPAIEAWAETADAIVWLPDALPADRLAPEVEATAYHVVTETVRRAGSTEATVRATRDNGRLVVSVATAVPQEGELIDLDDRVGALGGVLHVEAARIVAEFPCG